MATKEDCQRGEHTSDNQGLCWWCGCVVNQDWLDEYNGTQAADEHQGKAQAAQKGNHG